MGVEPGGEPVAERVAGAAAELVPGGGAEDGQDGVPGEEQAGLGVPPVGGQVELAGGAGGDGRAGLRDAPVVEAVGGEAGQGQVAGREGLQAEVAPQLLPRGVAVIEDLVHAHAQLDASSREAAHRDRRRHPRPVGQRAGHRVPALVAGPGGEALRGGRAAVARDADEHRPQRQVDQGVPAVHLDHAGDAGRDAAPPHPQREVVGHPGLDVAGGDVAGELPGVGAGVPAPVGEVQRAPAREDHLHVVGEAGLDITRSDREDLEGGGDRDQVRLGAPAPAGVLADPEEGGGARLDRIGPHRWARQQCECREQGRLTHHAITSGARNFNEDVPRWAGSRQGVRFAAHDCTRRVAVSCVRSRPDWKPPVNFALRAARVSLRFRPSVNGSTAGKVDGLPRRDQRLRWAGHPSPLSAHARIFDRIPR